MTDIQLLTDIVSETRSILEQKGIRMVLGEDLEEIKVHMQGIPVKRDEDDEKLRNYIVVMIAEENVEDGEWITEIHFSIHIEDRDRDRSGDLNVLFLMNEIYIHFMKQGIISKHCRIEEEAYKVLNLEAEWPYFEGDLVTKWKLPLPNEEGLEDFV